MPNSKKIALVQSIADSLKQSKNFILLKYGGVATQTFDSLRKDLKKTGSSLSIIKNTLFEKSINILSTKDKQFKDLRSKFFPLKEATAIIYLGEDWGPSLKTFYEFIQDKKNFSFKFGLLDKEVYPEPQLTKISKLPTRSELMAKLIEQMSNPTRRLVLSMKFNINKFVYILKQKS